MLPTINCLVFISKTKQMTKLTKVSPGTSAQTSKPLTNHMNSMTGPNKMRIDESSFLRYALGKATPAAMT